MAAITHMISRIARLMMAGFPVPPLTPWAGKCDGLPGHSPNGNISSIEDSG
jgi:hypothetical protein